MPFNPIELGMLSAALLFIVAWSRLFLWIGGKFYKKKTVLFFVICHVLSLLTASVLAAFGGLDGRSSEDFLEPLFWEKLGLYSLPQVLVLTIDLYRARTTTKPHEEPNKLT